MHRHDQNRTDLRARATRGHALVVARARVARSLLARTLLALMLLAPSLGCDRPLRVDVSIENAERLTLRGELEQEGMLRRTIENGDRRVERGTTVVVQETWLVRRERADPPAYRVVGLYDPARSTDGFTLPSGALDVYFVAAVLPDRVMQVVLPAEELEIRRE